MGFILLKMSFFVYLMQGFFLGGVKQSPEASTNMRVDCYTIIIAVDCDYLRRP